MRNLSKNNSENPNKWPVSNKAFTNSSFSNGEEIDAIINFLNSDHNYKLIHAWSIKNIAVWKIKRPILVIFAKANSFKQ